MSIFQVAIFMALLCFNLCPAEEKPLVLVSIPTYQEMLQELLGNDFSVESVVPENVNFHSYEPSMQKIFRYKQARVWFTIGNSFENRLEQFLCSQKQAPVVICLGNSGQKDSCCHELASENDPHSWTSPRTVKEQFATIALKITQLFPDKKDLFATNYAQLNSKLAQLISTIDDLLKDTQNKPLVIAHAAFGCLCRDYGIQQVALESGGKETTPIQLQYVLQKAAEHNVKTIFSLKGFPKKGIERVGEVLHATVVELDPYVHPYFKIMEYTAMEIKKALETEV